MAPSSSPFPVFGGASPFPLFTEVANSNATADQTARIPLGQRLLRAGLLTPAQLAQALREQQQNHLKLGEVCLEHRWVTPEALYRLTASQDLSLGEILIALGYLEFDQLRVALAQQRRYGRKLGDILLWKGWLRQEVLDQVLQIQRYLRQLATTDAWQALQEFMNPQAQSGSPCNSAPVSNVPATGSTSGSPILLNTSHSIPPHLLDNPSTAPASRSSDQSRIEMLERQMQLQQEEWDALLEQTNQQVIAYQTQYQQRIDQLEAALRQQTDQDQLQQQAQLELDHWRTQLQQEQQARQEDQARFDERQQQWQEREAHYKQELSHVKFQVDSLMQTLQTRQPQEGELDQLKHQLHQRQEELDRAQARIRSHQDHELQAFAETDRLRAQVAELQIELQEVRTQLAQQISADATQEHQQALLDHLRQELDTAQSLTQTQAEQIQTLQTQLIEATAETERLRAECLQAQDHIVELSKERQTQQDTIDQSVAQILNLKADLNELQQQHAALVEELNHVRELSDAYRQSVESLQQTLKMQQDQNRILQTSLTQQRLIAEAARSELSTPSLPMKVTAPESSGQRTRPEKDIDTQPDPGMVEGLDLNGSPVLTPWARTLFFQLQEAGLITHEEVDHVLKVWQQDGGKLTHVLSECTELQPTTVKFFGNGGYAARLAGCKRIGDYLQAAGLVTEAQIQAALSQRQPGQKLGEVLAMQGVIRAMTADYFARTFVQKGARS